MEKKKYKFEVSFERIGEIFKYFLLALLLIVPSVLFFLSQKEIRNLKQEVDKLKHDNKQIGITFEDYKNVVSAFYQEYQDSGLLTVEVLENTIGRMESAIEVYDENVSIYNSQIQELYSKVEKLEESVKIIANYLTY